jgi:hypothetical protein
MLTVNLIEALVKPLELLQFYPHLYIVCEICKVFSAGRMMAEKQLLSGILVMLA